MVDPELGADIVELGMARSATVADDGSVRVTVALTTAGCPLRAQLMREIVSRTEGLPGVTSVAIDWAEMNADQRSAAMDIARRSGPGIRRPERGAPGARVLAVASGKGGVGKSSITANLAAALAQRGFAVGVIDADIWGFSIPRMLGLEGRLEAEATDDGGRRIQPHSGADRPRSGAGCDGRRRRWPRPRGVPRAERAGNGEAPDVGVDDPDREAPLGEGRGEVGSDGGLPTPPCRRRRRARGHPGARRSAPADPWADLRAMSWPRTSAPRSSRPSRWRRR